MTTLPAIDISEIWTPPSIDDVRRLLLPFIAVDENPVTDWHSGAVLRTMYELEAYIMQDLVANVIPGIIGNGYPDTSGPSLSVVGRGQFGLDRGAPTAATQTITLACTADEGPYPIAAGRLYKATDGSIYQGLAGGTLPSGSTLTIDVGATSLGAARGLVATLVSPLPGVTVQSAAIKVVGGAGQFGSDAESDTAYKARMDGRFEDLDAAPGTQDRLQKWSLAAGTSTTRVRIYADPATPGGAILVLANNTGGIPSGEVTTVQNYVNARTFDDVTAVAAVTTTVNAAGTVLYPASWAPDQLSGAQAAADAAWARALAGNQIGGLLALSALNQAVMDQGAVDFTGKTLNGTPADLTLASGHVPVAGGSLASQLLWSPF